MYKTKILLFTISIFISIQACAAINNTSNISPKSANMSATDKADKNIIKDVADKKLAVIPVEKNTNQQIIPVSSSDISPNIPSTEAVKSHSGTAVKDPKKSQDTAPDYTLLGAVVALYAGLLIFFGVATEEIPHTSRNILEHFIKTLNKQIYWMLGTLACLVFICWGSMFLQPFLSLLVQMVFTILAIFIGLFCAKKMIKLLDNYNVISSSIKETMSHCNGEEKQQQIDKIIDNLQFYLTKEDFVPFRFILDTLMTAEDDQCLKNIVSQLWPLFKDERLVSNGSEFKLFIDKYMGLLSFSQDFEFFCYHLTTLLSYPPTWLNNSVPQLKERAGDIVSKSPYSLIRAIMFFPKEKKLPELKTKIIRDMFTSIVFLIKHNITSGLQETVINIINILEKNIPLDNDSFNEMISQIIGVIGIYLKEFAKKDTNKLNRDNLKVLLFILLKESFTRDTDNKRIVTAIAQLRLLLDDEDDDDKTFWLSDLVELTKYAAQAKNSEVLAYIITLWKRALSGKEAAYAKYLINSQELSGIPEIKKLIQ